MTTKQGNKWHSKLCNTKIKTGKKINIRNFYLRKYGPKYSRMDQVKLVQDSL